VEADPGMADLMNTQLDQLQAALIAKKGPRQGRMHKRVGFVFVSSPNSVTPVHFDIEHSLLMQVSGRKTVSIGRWENAEARRREFDRYWDGSHGRIESLPEEIASFTVTPGQAVFIPPGTPHWVQNGPDPSLSVTLTYFTAATVRENRVEDFNSHLRRRKMKPREPGRSALVDTAKVYAIGAMALGKRLRSAAGSPKKQDGSDGAYRVEGS
jgi:mannose-6-phosphate isomerase-like protein (cupin superfamily)